MQRISHLVIGSAGFIGSRLLKRLGSSSTIGIPSRALFQELMDIKRSICFESVYWAAGSIMPATSSNLEIKSSYDYRDLARFLQVFRGRYSRLIYLSSGGCVYGPGNGPFNEDSVASPVNQYGELKLACERLINTESELNIVLRTANVFGIGQIARKSQGVLPHWIESIKSNAPLNVLGELKSFRDYVDVDSVLDAIQLANNHSNSDIFNVGSGIPTTLAELISIFQEVVGKNLPLKLFDAREPDRLGYYLDCTKAKSVLGWNFRDNVRKSIERVVRLELL